MPLGPHVLLSISTSPTPIAPPELAGEALHLTNTGHHLSPVLWVSTTGPASVSGAGSTPLGPWGNTSGYPTTLQFSADQTISGISDGSGSGIAVQLEVKARRNLPEASFDPDKL